MKLQQDKYRRTRGGSSRFLDITCARAGHHLFFYQKDGPGILKRVYIDRIYPTAPKTKELRCSKCKEVLGIKIVYKKEGRPAFRLFVGAVAKKIISADKVK